MLAFDDPKGGKRFFPFYEDGDIGLSFKNLDTEDEDGIIDACQDDDQATDDEILQGGEQQCMQDLISLRDFIESR